MADGTELALADAKLPGLPERFQPRNLTELMAWAKLVNSSGLAPKGMNDAGIILAVQMGAELRVTPTQALQNIAVINGRPSIWGDLGLALFKRDAAYETFEERDPAEALEKKGGWCKIKMKGAEKPIIRTFSLAEAETAGLFARAQGGSDAKGKGPWITYPGRMLQMRARWWAMRDAAPEVFKGLAAREEQHDIVDATDVRVDGVEIAPPSRRSATAMATEVDNFVKSVKPAASGEAPGTKPPIDRSKLSKMMVVGAEERAGGGTTFYKIKIQPSSGPALEPSTFERSFYQTALDLKGKFALVALKTTTSKKDGKSYLNIEHIEADATPAPVEESAPPAPADQEEPGSNG